MTYPYESATDTQRQLGALWWCIHHDRRIEPLAEPVEARVVYIRANKPAHEIETRLRALRPVRGVVPTFVVQAGDTYAQARGALVQAGIACTKAVAAYEQAVAAYDQAWDALGQARDAFDQTLRDHAPAIEALWANECADIAWGLDGLMFPDPKETT